jgi:two-component system, NarL family, nitrate/nitrite response regulator NarL
MSSAPSIDRRSGPRTAIIDADRRVQQSLAEVLRVTGRVSVVGVAGDVRHGLELVEREHPDVVIVDPRLPDLAAGEAFLSGMRLAWPSTQVVLTGWTDMRDVPALSRLAAAFVTKSGSPEDFVTAVVNACCGAVDSAAVIEARAESA